MPAAFLSSEGGGATAASLSIPHQARPKTMSTTIDIPRLGEHIRSKRGERTLREVGDEIGVNMNTISRIERGFTKPDVDSYAKICAWLGVSMDTFRTSPTDVQAA